VGFAWLLGSEYGELLSPKVSNLCLILARKSHKNMLIQPTTSCQQVNISPYMLSCLTSERRFQLRWSELSSASFRFIPKMPLFWLSLRTLGKVKLKLNYDRQSVGQFVLVSGNHLGHATNFSLSLKFSLDSCGFVI
jgi:hypothetical protein